MRATEIIRGVLDLIDQVECAQQPQPEPVIGDFAQLFAQMTADKPAETPSAVVYDNSPNTHVQGIASVTTDAGLCGLNGPKNPADIRANSISMYPNFQAKE
jgi:hypothetical protein